jgi:hypothetical protein
MARVTYQGMLAATPGGAAGGSRYVDLPAGAVRTRRKDARASLTVKVSKDQRRWLREVAEVTGGKVDEDAVIRALIDVGRELPVDWPLVASGAALREAVAASVGVRAPGAADDTGAR